MAVIRHESSYRATAVSRAGATGLMQLMPKTAASVARRLLDIKAPSRKALKEPKLNISLGTRLLKELMSLFHGNEALVLAAYNAGSGSARRWLKKHWARQQQHTDIFVEEIPAAETHAYVKAVLGSYGAYQFLYGEPDDKAFLSIPLEVHLPTTLGPYFRPKTR
jgi:soluble lytic murein transglycosylase